MNCANGPEFFFSMTFKVCGASANQCCAGFVQHVGYARHYPQQNEHEQHGCSRCGVRAGPWQHFHGTGEHQGEQTGERGIGDEGDVGKIQQQSDRARNQNPDSRHLGLLATVPGRASAEQAVLFFLNIGLPASDSLHPPYSEDHYAVKTSSDHIRRSHARRV